MADGRNVEDADANQPIPSAIAPHPNPLEKMQSGVDMPLLRTITDIVGQSIWFKAIVAFNHVSFAPLEDPKDHEKG
ncbi:hypothetical protein Tco_0978225 [Tanacetum coccineum]|uniref:Uncharacterized protein n=1 Tax=Tanacetum coccineum TaxID=301880 RepID=A0ABQ5EMC1_9ASTR